ncbi:HPP family protein [Streptomyces fradiae]|uniref:HPP family protein n=1 Tax=Streptomyces fradiae TaxID=1906 RepID=UPI003518A563
MTTAQPAAAPAVAVRPASAPPRPRPRVLLASTAISVTALLLLVAVGTVLHQPLLIPPLAASMALVAGAPDLPLAQPRSVVGGQLLSALTGFAVLALAGPGLWSAALAGGLALGVMAAARTPHSPAAATAVIVALQHPPVLDLPGPPRPRGGAPGRRRPGGRARDGTALSRVLDLGPVPVSP